MCVRLCSQSPSINGELSFTWFSIEEIKRSRRVRKIQLTPTSNHFLVDLCLSFSPPLFLFDEGEFPIARYRRALNSAG